MEKDKPMTILLVEDDLKDCCLYENYCYTRDDIKIIDIVSSPKDALKSTKTNLPDSVILDIELNSIDGTGLNYLEEQKKLVDIPKPLIAVVTNVISNSVKNYAHQNGADLVFEKLKNYSPEIVISNLLLLRESNCTLNSLENKDFINVESIAARNKRISDRIDRELDLIGMGSHLIGRKYIHDSILYILQEENTNPDTAFLHLTKLHHKAKTSINTAIQKAIDSVWNKYPTDDLKKYYTAALVDPSVGSPRPKEFIYHYINKISKSI